MKKVMIIDDSALMRRTMSDIINSTNEYIVAYNASNGADGYEIIKSNDDILAVFCDVNMPRMSGIELLKLVRKGNISVPFIMISSNADIGDTINALELGAFEFIKKPESVFDKKSAKEYSENIIKTLHMADEICEKSKKSFSSNAKAYKTKQFEAATLVPDSKKNIHKKTSGGKKIIALVCSTGGPKALQQVVPKLPADLPVPMLVVQHMPANFTESMANRLNELSRVTVKEAEDGEKLLPGTVYVAKGGTHLTVSDGRVRFYEAPPVVGLKPCGNIMYSSLVDSDYDEIICVVLTGMGADGTKGIVELSKTKNIYVIAQDESSSTVYGMPKAIYESGVTDCVCSIDKIANEISRKVGV